MVACAVQLMMKECELRRMKNWRCHGFESLKKEEKRSTETVDLPGVPCTHGWAMICVGGCRGRNLSGAASTVHTTILNEPCTPPHPFSASVGVTGGGGGIRASRSSKSASATANSCFAVCCYSLDTRELCIKTWEPQRLQHRQR